MNNINITESDIFTAIGDILSNFLPGLVIIKGQVNKVATPKSADYLVMWPISRVRLETNTDFDTDNQIKGSINDNILTVTSIIQGGVYPGTFLYASNIPVGNGMILYQMDGTPHGVGYYQLSNSPNLTNQIFYCGSHSVMQPTEIVVQCDVHGPQSGNNATVISSLWRDDYGATLAQTLGGVIAPFYADDPLQSPFTNDQQQWEERWVVDLHMQANLTVNVSQQFMDEISISTIGVFPNAGQATGGGATVNSVGIVEVP